MKSPATSLLLAGCGFCLLLLSLAPKRAACVSSEVATIFSELIGRVNRRAMVDLRAGQRILRLTNQTCLRQEMQIEARHALITGKVVLWRSEETRKVLEAIWLSAPLCWSGFDREADEQFESVVEALRSDVYGENLGCFKYKLASLQPLSPLLIEFDRKSVASDQSLVLACENFVAEFYGRFLKLTFESLKSDMAALRISVCNEESFVSANERRKNLLKLAIVANTVRVPVKYLKITKNEFRESLRMVGRAMKDCILSDIRAGF